MGQHPMAHKHTHRPTPATPSLRPCENQAQKQRVECVKVFPDPAMKSKRARDQDTETNRETESGWGETETKKHEMESQTSQRGRCWARVTERW